jgi:outer membrane receptor protein involved in Fe transport
MAGTLSASEHRCSVLDSSPARTALSSVGRLEQAGIADFLLGHFNRSEGQVGAPIANFRSGYYALYVQDSWKVRPTLTINYGLRWEYDQPFYDTNDNIVNIDFK